MHHGSPTIPFLAALVVLGTTSCGPGTQYPEELAEVRISRSPGLGFCVDEGQLVSGRVAVSAGVGTLSGTVAVPGDPVTDECFDTWGDCLISGELEARTLSGDELEALREHVAAVVSKRCARDPHLACDPCVVTTITVDDVAEDDYCCGEINSSFTESFRVLARFLDGLAAD